MFGSTINFFYSWYIDDTINFWNWFIDYLKMLDRDIGLIGNLQNWTSPLFGDYSFTGRAVGPVLRTLRIFFGITFYAVIAVFSLAAYLFWIILPIAAIIMALLNLLVLFKQPEPVFALGGEFLNLFIR